MYSSWVSAPATQPTYCAMSARVASSMSGSAITSETAKRPPGLSTRAVSRSTRGLSVERLITQFESTTSTLTASGSGIASIWPLSQRDVLDAGLGLVRAREVEHLVGHVEPVRDAGRGDAAGREQHVDPAAGAEVEHDVAGAEVDHRERVAAAQRGLQRGVGQLVLLAVGVQARAEQLGLLVGDHRGVRSAAARGDRRVGGGERGRGVAGADGLAQRRPAAQPQLPPAALVSQHAAFSLGSQQVSCAAGEQHADDSPAGVRSVSSAMRSAPPARRAARSSRPTARAARSRRCRRRGAS